MKISTKIRYSVRALLFLARDASNKPHSLVEISWQEGISLPYLRQIFNQLKRKGIVKSSKGPGGGFVLSRLPEEISIGEIARAFDNMSLANCVENTNMCSRTENCASRILWEKLGKNLALTLNETNLANLLEEEDTLRRKLNEKSLSG